MSPSTASDTAAVPGGPPANDDLARTRIDCELRDHLNVIIGFAGLLVDSGRLDESQRRYASHIAAAGGRACAMLRSFLEEYRAGPRSRIAPPRTTGLE
jgi:hypothetical protein